MELENHGAESQYLHHKCGTDNNSDHRTVSYSKWKHLYDVQDALYVSVKQHCCTHAVVLAEESQRQSKPFYLYFPNKETQF